MVLPVSAATLVQPSQGDQNTLPMGYTDDGQEIVASWANCSGWVVTRKIIFQFWGAGARGEMGEDGEGCIERGLVVAGQVGDGVGHRLRLKGT